MRGSAWTSVAKDTLILAVVLFLGIYLPIHYYGGLSDMFHTINAAKPGFLTFPRQRGPSVAWFQSTVLLTTRAGVFHVAAYVRLGIYSKKDERIFRH